MATESTTPKILGNLPGLPGKLVFDAAMLARRHGAQGISDMHLVSAALATPTLADRLAELGCSAQQLAAELESHLATDAPPAVLVIDHPDGEGVQVITSPTIDGLEGRAVVLAATPDRHAVDEIDVFVAALMNPQTHVSMAVSKVTSLDRNELLRQLAQGLNRYGGVHFVPSRVVEMLPPVTFPWAVHERVVAFAREVAPTDAYWTYYRDDEIDSVAVWSDSRGLLAALEAQDFVDN